MTFFSSGSVTLGATMVDSDGYAELTAAALPAGTIAATASYSGDATYAPSSAGPIAVTIAAPPSPQRTGPQPPSPSPSPQMPYTGVPAEEMTVLAGLLLAAGAVLLSTSRRRDLNRGHRTG